jgi:hypothetical protein
VSRLSDRIAVAVVMGCILLVALSSCATPASVASRNLSTAADLFQINRRVVFYNGITGDYILVVEGKCSINVDGLDNQLELTCRIGDDEYIKHFLGLSDNVTYFAEQVDSANVSTYHYKVVFRPATIVPSIQID